MAQLVVRNIPESVKERLKRRAKKHGRSMEEEVREILRVASRDGEEPQEGLGTQIANRFRAIGPGEAPVIEELRGFKLRPPKFD